MSELWKKKGYETLETVESICGVIEMSEKLDYPENVLEEMSKEELIELILEMKNKKTNEMVKWMENGKHVGHCEGSLDEAKENLKRRFTDRELDVVINLVWFSPMMQSIRNRLTVLEEQKKKSDHQ